MESEAVPVVLPPMPETLTTEGIDSGEAGAPTALLERETQLQPLGGPWPNGARIAVALTLAFEGGALSYARFEGIRRMLDVASKHGVKITCSMTPEAIDASPDVAREIVRQGHEAVACGDDRRAVEASLAAIERVTGERPEGANAAGSRDAARSAALLADFGLTYFVGEPHRDEPSLARVRGGEIVAMPSSPQTSDRASYPLLHWDPVAYEQLLRDEFDQLYDEGAERRRLMVVALCDELCGSAGRARVLDRFLGYASGRDGVWFAKLGDVARFAREHRAATPTLDVE